ncbi:MAG: ABC transporter permease, partial [Anaerolineae bacterium]
NYRENGVLRRFSATPLHPAVYMAAEILQFYLMSLAGVILLALVGYVAYDVRVDGGLGALFLGFTLSALSTFALGYLIAGLAPSARVAQTVGMVLAFPMMFLSGATIPLQVMPESIQRLADWIPLTYVVRLMQGLWFGEGWEAVGKAVWVLVIVGAICAALSARTFRWGE